MNKKKGKLWKSRLIPCIVILAMTSFSLNSCTCTEMLCEGADNLNCIFLYNFSGQDCDSVYIVNYMRGTDYRSVVDSFLVENIEQPDPNIYVLVLEDRRISVRFEHKVYFPSANKQYTISEFKTNSEICNKCTPAYLSDHYNKLTEYQINGNVKQYARLEIDKDKD
jgi:hypothetical protein